jgi:UDP-glucose 4-epimerase
MRILVTGAAGFIGGYLVEELLSRGHTVIGLDDLSKYGCAARAIGDHPRYRGVIGDAKNIDLFSDLLSGCDQLIANAALIDGVSYMHDLPYDIMSVNNQLTKIAIETAIHEHRHGSLRKVTYISSSMVYERDENIGLIEGGELEIPPPLSAYGFQKLATEYYARAAWRQYGLPYTIVRPFNCVGAGERRAVHERALSMASARIAHGHVIPDFVERAIRRETPFRILGNGRQFRKFIYARDLARGIALAVESESAYNEDFNLSGPDGCTIEELAHLIWEKVNPGVKLHIKYEQEYPNDVRIRHPKTCKARDLLGFEPTTSLTFMIAEVIEWVRCLLEGSGTEEMAT